MKLGIGASEIVFPPQAFPNPRERYTGVHDNPLVHAMILEAGERFCFIFADVGDPGDWMELRKRAAQTAEVPVEHVVLHTSHVLSTPHCTKPHECGSDQERIRDGIQRASVAEGICNAVADAAGNVEPVKVGIGYATCGINANRVLETAEGYGQGINEAGDTDHTIPVLCFRTLDGTRKGVLYAVNVAPAVLEGSRCRDDSRLVSGDLASASERLLEEKLGGKAIYVTGASADQWPVLRAVRDYKDAEGYLHTADYQDEGFFIVELLSQRLAQEVSETVAGIVCHESAETAALHTLELSLPGHDRLPPPVMRQMSRTVTFTPSEDVKTTVYALTVGDTVIVGCQPEICVATLRHIREQSPFAHTILLEFVNGLGDYMVTKDLYEKAAPHCKKGRFSPGSAELFEQQVVQFLRQLKAGKAD